MTKLYIIGIGPGDLKYLSLAAQEALAGCTDIVGHGLYLKLLGDLAKSKNKHCTPMGEEIARAQLALELATSGNPTALISSGDAGIYGMATVVFEILNKQQKKLVDIEVIPGITAMQAVAARVGAPLANDFCVISLSDLLIPWSKIVRRIELAGQGDFVIAFYNAVSKQRCWQLTEAKTILMRYRLPETPVIIAFNVTRKGEYIALTTLSSLDPKHLNMLSLVVIGNSDTKQCGQWIYTARGYHKKLV